MTVCSTMNEVPIKFFVIRKGETVDVRRRCLVSPSYEALTQTVSEFAKGEYRMQYTDDDNDLVTMSSQVEWEECLRVWDTQSPLKLRVELAHVSRCGRSRSNSGERRHCRWGRSVSPWRRQHIGHLAEAFFGTQQGAEGAEGERDTHAEATSHPAERLFRGWSRALAAARKEGEKCLGCEFKTTGLVPGYCCRCCMKGKARHGPMCRQILVAAPQRNAEAEAAAVDHPKPEQTHQDTGSKCLNCDYEATGHDGYCCKACRFGKGKGHGTRCQKKLFAAESRESSSADEKKKGAEEAEACVDWKCLGCDYRRTRNGKYCCAACRRGSGQHNRRCEGALTAAEQKPDAHSDETDHAVGNKCRNCDFETTGVVDGYCCNACKLGKRKGAHGPRCQQKKLLLAADNSSDDATSARKCLNCDYQTTGVVDGYCCNACRLGKSKGHGRRCQKKRVPAVEGATAAEGVEKPEDDTKEHQEVSSDSPVIVEKPAEEPCGRPRFAAQLAQLEEMGFEANEAALAALVASQGDLASALAMLL